MPLPLPRSVYKNRSFLTLPLIGNAGSAAEIALLAPITLFALTGLWGAFALTTGLVVA
jgi:hypothetical protein